MAFPVHVRIRPARATDAGELFTLQRAAYLSEAQRRRDPFVAPLADDVDDVSALIDDGASTLLVASAVEDGEHGRRGRLVGSIRLTLHGGTGRVGRVVVAPDLRGRGLGSTLLEALHAEAEHQPGIEVLELSTGTAASGDLALYRRYGYLEAGTRLGPRGEEVPIMRRQLR